MIHSTFLRLAAVVLVTMSLLGTTAALAGNVLPEIITIDSKATEQSHQPGMGVDSPVRGHAPPLGMHVECGQGRLVCDLNTTRVRFMVMPSGDVPIYSWFSPINRTINTVRIMGIVEYTDANADDEFSREERVQFLSLFRNASWGFSDPSANDTTIVFSFYTTDINVSGFDQTSLNFTNYINKDENQLKFDIEINGWPWISEANRLAFIFEFRSIIHDQRPRHIQMFNKSIDNPMNRTDPHGFFMRGESGDIAGFFTASDTAWSSEANGSVPVATQIVTSENKLGADIYLNYPYFGERLVHDPILGVGDEGDLASTIKGVISSLISRPGLLAITTVLGALAVVAIFVLRRRNL